MAFIQRNYVHDPVEKGLVYKPVGKNDLVKGNCSCYRCDKLVVQFYYAPNCILCIDCVLELDPPKWRLILTTTSQSKDNHIEPADSYTMWDDTYKRREETLTLGEIIKCGWFTRKIEEISTKVPRRTIKKINLEYHGKRPCVRFKSHYANLGLEHIPSCRSPFCEYIYTNVCYQKQLQRYR